MLRPPFDPKRNSSAWMARAIVAIEQKWGMLPGQWDLLPRRQKARTMYLWREEQEAIDRQHRNAHLESLIATARSHVSRR